MWEQAYTNTILNMRGWEQHDYIWNRLPNFLGMLSLKNVRKYCVATFYWGEAEVIIQKLQVTVVAVEYFILIKVAEKAIIRNRTTDFRNLSKTQKLEKKNKKMAHKIKKNK